MSHFCQHFDFCTVQIHLDTLHAHWTANRAPGTCGLLRMGWEAQEKGQEAGTACAIASTDGGGNQESLKKKRSRATDWATEKKGSIRREDLRDLQTILDGKKNSPHKFFFERERSRQLTGPS